MTLKTVLLWGLPGDGPLAAVRHLLQSLGCQATLVDQRSVLETEVDLSVGSTVEGLLRLKSHTIDLASVTSVYMRPYDSRRLPVIASAGPGSPEWRHALAVEDILTSWAELTPALVVNRPRFMAANASKPYQAAQVEALAFRTPTTLITNDPRAVLEFWQQHEKVIYKSLSGVRSIVSRLTPEHERRFQDITACPTQFQEYIPGTEYRVHVVEEDVFACRIESQSDDYRYSVHGGPPARIEPCSLDEEIAARCRMLAKAMNLAVAGIDLRRAPDGTWYCFEVNPSPGFVYFQEATGQPIGQSIAHLLLAGRTPDRRDDSPQIEFSSR